MVSYICLLVYTEGCMPGVMSTPGYTGMPQGNNVGFVNLFYPGIKNCFPAVHFIKQFHLSSSTIYFNALFTVL